jgi:hypothetical protein
MRYRLLVNFSTLSVRLLQKIGKPLSTGPIILVKRDFFNTLDGYDSSVVISEDHNLIVKAYKRGVKAHFLSDVECLFSMRRFEKEGIWNVVRKYAYFIVITLIKGGVYNKSKSFSYETGGHNFSKATEQSKHNHNTKN